MRVLSVVIPGLLAFALGCGSSDEVKPERAVVFVRGGFVLPADADREGGLTVAVDGTDVELTARRLGTDRLLFEYPWQPGRDYVLVSGGARQTLTAPVRPEAVSVAVVELEKVHAGSVVSGGEPDASVAFSADGSRLALGTFGGYLRVFDTRTGMCVFERRFPGAVVKRVAISHDNTRVYAGEMSYDGFVSAFDLATGRRLWRFRLADELETSEPAKPDDLFAIYAYPQVYCMHAVSDDVVVDGMHSWKPGGKPRHLSRLYRFDGKTGRLRWRFPRDKPLERNIVWFDVSGPTLALAAHQWEKPRPGDTVPQNAVMLLDADSGALIDTHIFKPLEPFFTTAPMWYGLALNDVGHLAVGLMDGRGAVFHTRADAPAAARKLKPVGAFDLATPIEVSGVPIYAGAGWAAGDGSLLYIMTDGRLTAPSAGGRKAVGADHPAANTVFAFDGRTGKRLWQWKLTTTAQFLAAGRNVLAASTQQSFSPDDPMDYGVTVFDTAAEGAPVEKLLYRYHTAGPIVALAVSPDGKTLAAVEAAVRLADDINTVGKYRLHILH